MKKCFGCCFFFFFSIFSFFSDVLYLTKAFHFFFFSSDTFLVICNNSPLYTIFTILYLVLAHHYARKKPLLCCSHSGMCQNKIHSGIWGYLNEPAHEPFDILTQLQRPPFSLRRLLSRMSWSFGTFFCLVLPWHVKLKLLAPARSVEIFPLF